MKQEETAIQTAHRHHGSAGPHRRAPPAKLLHCMRDAAGCAGRVTEAIPAGLCQVSQHKLLDELQTMHGDGYASFGEARWSASLGIISIC